MIQAKELRVGNTYLLNIGVSAEMPGGSHGIGFQQVTIDENLMGKIFSSDTTLALQDFYPIPVTYEILKTIKHAEKQVLGWTLSISGMILQYKAISVDTNGMMYIREGSALNDRAEDSLVCVHNADIHGPLYLHKLQNLYNLLSNGEELEFTA